jgi:hypothetical protein
MCQGLSREIFAGWMDEQMESKDNRTDERKDRMGGGIHIAAT